MVMSFCKNGHEMVGENVIQRYAKNGTKNGRRCRLCTKNDPRIKDYRRRTEFQLKCRYGITSLEERDKLLESQDGRCAICGTSACSWDKGFQNVWHIDHKHDGTANHRGILCAKCNNTLGRLNDDPQFIQKFIDYLKSY